MLTFKIFTYSQCLCVGQMGLKLRILLSQSPKCWNYRYEVPHLVYACKYA